MLDRMEKLFPMPEQEEKLPKGKKGAASITIVIGAPAHGAAHDNEAAEPVTDDEEMEGEEPVLDEEGLKHMQRLMGGGGCGCG